MTAPDPVGSPKLAPAAARVRKILEQAARLRSRAQISGLERPILVGGFLIFSAATVLAIRNLPPIEGGVRWSLLPVFVLLLPVGVAFNAGEYLISARVVGRRVRVLPSFRVAAMAAAANQLPIPGSVLLRTQALKETGVGYGRALGSTGLTGLAYVGAALALVGGILLLDDFSVVPAVLVAVGLACIALTYLGIRAYRSGSPVVLTSSLTGIEAASTLAKATAFFVVARSLHFDVSFSQSLVIILSAVITSSVGFFPGGLGLRELLAGGISSLVDLSASVGVVTTAANRIAGLIFLSLLTLILALTDRYMRSRAAEPSSVQEQEILSVNGTGS